MSSGQTAELVGRVVMAFRRQLAAGIVFNQQVFEHLGLGVSASDGQFMTLLQFQGPLSPGELARLSGLSTGTVTGVVDRLERAGLVQRTRHASDRRKVVVSLDADRIERELGPLYAPQSRRLAEVVSSYTPEQLELIAGFLERVVGDPYGADDIAALDSKHADRDRSADPTPIGAS
jgi:DNA-binding MarR family transcriptional regulator